MAASRFGPLPPHVPVSIANVRPVAPRQNADAAARRRYALDRAETGKIHAEVELRYREETLKWHDDHVLAFRKKLAAAAQEARHLLAYLADHSAEYPPEALWDGATLPEGMDLDGFLEAMAAPLKAALRTTIELEQYAEQAVEPLTSFLGLGELRAGRRPKLDQQIASDLHDAYGYRREAAQDVVDRVSGTKRARGTLKRSARRRNKRQRR